MGSIINGTWEYIGRGGGTMNREDVELKMRMGGEGPGNETEGGEEKEWELEGEEEQRNEAEQHEKGEGEKQLYNNEIEERSIKVAGG